MIIVKVELHSAITGKVTELGRLRITNDGTGSAERGNYDVAPFGKGGRSILRMARVENYPRLSYSVFRLIRLALEALGV